MCFIILSSLKLIYHVVIKNELKPPLTTFMINVFEFVNIAKIFYEPISFFKFHPLVSTYISHTHKT